MKLAACLPAGLHTGYGQGFPWEELQLSGSLGCLHFLDASIFNLAQFLINCVGSRNLQLKDSTNYNTTLRRKTSGTGFEPKGRPVLPGATEATDWDSWVTGQGNQELHGPWQLC